MVAYVDIRKARNKPAQSLKLHLALGFGLFTLLLSAAISFLVGYVLGDSSTRQTGHHLEQLAGELRDRLDHGMYERFREIQSLAALDAGMRVEGRAAERRSRIEALREQRPVYAWIGYADASGRVLTATTGTLEGEDVSGLPWFKRGITGPAVGDVHESPRLSRPAGGPLRSVDIAVPVRDAAGRVTGVLGAYLDWDAFGELRSPLAREFKPIVAAGDGTVFFGPQELAGKKLELRTIAHATAAHDAWSVEQWPDGARYFTAASVMRGRPDYPELGWKVVLRQDAGAALADVGRMRLQIFAVGGLLGVAFAALALWIAARVAEPLTAIAAAADRLGAGERDVSIPWVSGYGEVERLSVSLHGMLSNLRRQEEDLLQARDKLELRVRERAAELTRTRADLEATIVEREHAQRELAQSKERLELALDAAGVAVWTYDLASGRIELSEQWGDMIGGARRVTAISLEEMTALVPEQERAAVRNAIGAAASGTTQHYEMRHHVRRANGELLLIVSRGKVVERGPDGSAVRMAGTVRAANEGLGQPTPSPRARFGS